MVPFLFVFCICFLAFMCNAVCDMKTSNISFLACFVTSLAKEIMFLAALVCLSVCLFVDNNLNVLG